MDFELLLEILGLKSLNALQTAYYKAVRELCFRFGVPRNMTSTNLKKALAAQNILIDQERDKTDNPTTETCEGTESGKSHQSPMAGFPSSMGRGPGEDDRLEPLYRRRWSKNSKKPKYSPKLKRKAGRRVNADGRPLEREVDNYYQRTDNSNGPSVEAAQQTVSPWVITPKPKRIRKPVSNRKDGSKQAQQPQPTAPLGPKHHNTGAKPREPEATRGFKRRRVEDPAQERHSESVPVSQPHRSASSSLSVTQDAQSQTAQKKVVRFATVNGPTKGVGHNSQGESSKIPQPVPRNSPEANRAKKNGKLPAAVVAAAPVNDDATMNDHSHAQPEKLAPANNAQDDVAPKENGVTHEQMPQEPAQSSQETVGQALGGLSLEGDLEVGGSDLPDIDSAELDGLNPEEIGNGSEEPYDTEDESEYESDSDVESVDDLDPEQAGEEGDENGQNPFYHSTSDPDA